MRGTAYLVEWMFALAFDAPMDRDGVIAYGLVLQYYSTFNDTDQHPP